MTEQDEPEDWRSAIRRRQREALDGARTVVSGTGPYGQGGLGRHLAELVEALRANRELQAYISSAPRHDDAAGISLAAARSTQLRLRVPPTRFSPGRRVRLVNDAFDQRAARLLPDRAERLLAFNGAALSQFDRARELDYASVALVSANGHLAHVARQHEKAWRQFPLERPWGPRNLARNLAEYARADTVFVASSYVWRTFEAEGFPAERLRLFRLTPDDRFQPGAGPTQTDTFDVLYSGSLAVHKGVPLLISAFQRLAHPDARLILVGGPGSRGMRRFVARACAQDPRISVRPGDPLPHLQRARVYVQASYEEGYAYAVAEAAACGVPLILSEDAAMVTECIPALPRHAIVPTGDLDALTQALEAAYQAG